jgi:hypothetical protein
MRLSDKTANMTSFHGSTIKTTVRKLMETNLGGVFTIYDWKEYRPLDLDEVIEFHIGGHSKHVTEHAKEELENILND